jgi:UDP-N-acetylglucosamine 2-epimerase (non-hydrolysing)/GDP/UDP-N,N'-diacetylbacillosamine 2-epimerase (hydrolysing)
VTPSKRKICVVTGTRSEYGLLYWALKEIEADPELTLQLVVTGMHLSPEFGSTYRMILQDGFSIDAKVEMLLSSDSAVGISKSMGLGIMGYAEALDRLQPDLVLILGDRFEILAVAQAALVAGIPIAHISGGESTEGAIDEAIRHAVTKMSSFHFVAAESYRRRVIQLGEHPDRVFNVGDPGIENIRRITLRSREELEEIVGLDLRGGFFLVTYHPVTLAPGTARSALVALFNALDRFPDQKIIITKANSDSDGRTINLMIDQYAAHQPGRVYATTSLGQINYLSAMRHCGCVVGNSSSGIVEAPYLNKPTVNVGMRQNGRLKAVSVIDCEETTEAILSALTLARSTEFAGRITGEISLYGGGNTSAAIVATLKAAKLEGAVIKSFYDLPAGRKS